MTKKASEYNIGLLAGLRSPQLEAIRAVGFVGDRDGWARLAMARCVLCHFRREVEVSGGQLTACTGVQGNAYNYLEQLTTAGLVAESHREKPTRHTPKGVVWYEAVSPAADRAVDAVPIPIQQCAEAKNTDTRR